MSIRKLSLIQVSSIFTIFTIYFYILLYTLLPFIKSNFVMNGAVYWFTIGYFLFIPLFIFSILAVRKEGNRRIHSIMQALNIRKMSKYDLKYSIIGLFLVFIFTGIIFAISTLLTHLFDIRPLITTPWFMEIKPFQGTEILLLFVWVPMFFFNIVGEEILWRGYIQTRLEGKYNWLICSFLWMIFHLPFGIDLMIMLIPVVLIIPFIYKKTNNTMTAIFIHGIFNGPTFIFVSLGIIK